MIESNPRNLVAAFEMLLEEIDAEIQFADKIGTWALHQCPGRLR